MEGLLCASPLVTKSLFSDGHLLPPSDGDKEEVGCWPKVTAWVEERGSNPGGLTVLQA